MFITTISDSKLSTYKQCKLKYNYRYVEKLYDPEAIQQPHFGFGQYIHKILEEGVSSKEEMELINIAAKVKSNYEISPEYAGKELICIKNFLKFNKSLEETLATELAFDVVLKDDITINGVIDRVVKGTNGGYLIIDYKTSKNEKTKADLFMDSQLKGYVYAIHSIHKVPIANITAAHYYPLTNNFVPVKYSIPVINSYIQSVVNTVWKIRKDKKEDLKSSRNKFCNWCDYKNICPEFNDPNDCIVRIDEIKKRMEAKKEQEKESLNEN